MYCVLMLLSFLFAFLNALRTDGWTGDKDLWDYSKSDWILTAIIACEEILLLSIGILFCVLACRIGTKVNTTRSNYYEARKLQDIEQVNSEFDYVWLDFSGFERALIKESNGTFLLTVQDFDEKTENWTSIGSVSVYPTLDDVKRSLFYDCDFYCDENAEFDKYGD